MGRGLGVTSRAGLTLPDGAEEYEIDCPAYGRLGLSGGLVCDIPAPCEEGHVHCRVWVEGEEGQAWFNGPRPILIQGKGASSTPVYPDFMQQGWIACFPMCANGWSVQPSAVTVRSSAADTTIVRRCEIALALKLSARSGHERIERSPQQIARQRFIHTTTACAVVTWRAGGASAMTGRLRWKVVLL